MGIINSRTVVLKGGERVMIRHCESGDARCLLELSRKNLTGSPRFNISMAEEMRMGEAEERAFIEVHLEKPDWLALAAFVEDELAGFLRIDTAPRQRLAHCGVVHMAVAEAWRGRGVGSALMEAALEWAKQHKAIEKLTLSVFSNNPRAIHLYSKFGFLEEGRMMKGIKFAEDDYTDEILMSRFV